MPDQRSPLDHLQSRIDRLPDRPSGLLDLGHALAGQPDSLEKRTCAVYQDTLPDYIEAELNDQPARRLFPDLARHLDLCSDCGQAYVDLLEIALQAEVEPLPAPGAVPALDLSFLPSLTPAEQMRRVVETLAEGLIRRLSPEALPDLLAASRAFFRWLGELGADLQPRRGTEFALAFGADLPPALQMVAVVYIATDRALRALSVEELSAELSGARPPHTLQKQARLAARAMGLRRKEAKQLANKYVALAQTHAADLLALARGTTAIERPD